MTPLLPRPTSLHGAPRVLGTPTAVVPPHLTGYERGNSGSPEWEPLAAHFNAGDGVWVCDHHQLPRLRGCRGAPSGI